MTPSKNIADRFRQMPIRRKLRVVIFFTTVLALLLAGLGIMAADLVLSYNGLQRDLSTFVQIIGDNSTGALDFSDAKAAAETLTALRARTHVQTACLYQNDGTQLAIYVRSGYSGICPSPEGERIRKTDWALIVSHPITRAGHRSGTLVLSYDLKELLDRLQLYGGVVLLALLFASAFALILSSRLRTLIAGPILGLANAAKTIAETKDYGIRAKEPSGDEVGILSHALNQMLDAIQSRDADLRKALNAEQDAVKRLGDLNADLKRSNQDLERVAFVASHDLQEPLRMITSYSQLLVARHSTGQSEKAGDPDFIKYIVEGTNRMRDLLSDLLAYTEVSGSAEQTLESVDLNLMVKKVTETLSASIAETGAEVIADRLPVLNAHESRLTSVFLNLIGNAIKYRSEAAPRIHISFKQCPEAFEFAIADNGIGIAPEYQQKVFVAFKRLHGREIPGTGIGLAICQRIVERYGGRIWVDSVIGQGSTFRFTLPRVMAQRTM
jgi:signal transduction histidine kinase